MVEFLHWRIYSSCVYFIYPLFCSYQKQKGFFSCSSPYWDLGTPNADWRLQTEILGPALYHKEHVQSIASCVKGIGKGIICGTNSTPGTRGLRASF